ncbi:MAG: c-type cytochrome [Planctomycetaceae bacterium]|nr:c-type cytochrome [Planctomycetaceae bacterium]
MRTTLCLSLTFAVLFLLSTPAAYSQSSDDYQPKIAGPSNEGQLALKGFVIPEGMSGKLAAAEPQVANPVAFTVTLDGRVIVCETFRQEQGVEDNRGHMNWLEADLQLESVEERAAMFRRFMGADVSKWGVEHDRLRMLKDTDGDGVFDQDTVFADGFNEIVDGTGASVLEHNGRVYYTCIPKLWSFTDSNNDGVADSSEAMHHGYGVRVAFRGHDLHGLTVGPDGRIYFSLGDRGYNVITKESKRLKRPDTGAVFRCDADGSNLEVFAFGLRNPQELAFDDNGNLFTGDNNSDSGDQARWVYVVQDGDTGWRMYYQYLDDRGPWNREKIWRPFRFDEETSAVQPASTLPPVLNLGDGPSGLTYYPGLGLPDRYRNHFFLADFRGTAGNSGIRSFTVVPNGASFQIEDSHQFLWSILATDVDFAPDGSIVISDWVNGWNGEGKGRLYRFTHDQAVADAASQRSASLLGGEIAKSESATLVDLLSHADRRVRQQAQFELVRRKATEELTTAAKSVSHETLSRHGIWGCWQLGLESAQQVELVAPVLAELLSTSSASDELKVQVIRVVSDLVSRHGRKSFSENNRAALLDSVRLLMQSDNLRVAGFAAVACGALGKSEDVAPLLTLLNRIDNNDPVARHQASMGLLSLGQRHPGLLESLATTSGAPARLGVLLALRRMGSASVAAFLGDAEPLIVAEAARAINDEPIEAAQGALADLIEAPGLDDNTLRRSMNAAYRRGLASDAANIAKVAANVARADNIRLVAVDLLRSWNQTQSLDSVTGRWRPLPQRNVDGLDESIRLFVPAMLTGNQELRTRVVEMATELGIRDIQPTLQTILHDTNQDEQLRLSAFKALARMSDDVPAILERGLKDPSESIQLSAIELVTRRDPQNSIERLGQLAESGSVRARQTAMQLLGSIPGERAENVLLKSFEQLHQGSFPAGAVLDLLVAAEKQNTAALKKEIEAYRSSQKDAGTVLALWSDCSEGGNSERGRALFFGRSAASCRRCHKVQGSGGEVGPDLSKIGKEKERAYLLEAIVDPNAKIAKGFETVILVTADGKIHSGILKSEDDSVVQLMTPTGALVSVLKEEIDERANGQSGMPQDLIKNLTRAEIRDLVEYLTTLQSEKAAGH